MATQKQVVRVLELERPVKHSVRYIDRSPGPQNLGVVYIPNGVLASLADGTPATITVTLEVGS